MSLSYEKYYLKNFKLDSLKLAPNLRLHGKPESSPCMQRVTKQLEYKTEWNMKVLEL